MLTPTAHLGASPARPGLLGTGRPPPRRFTRPADGRRVRRIRPEPAGQQPQPPEPHRFLRQRPDTNQQHQPARANALRHWRARADAALHDHPRRGLTAGVRHAAPRRNVGRREHGQRRLHPPARGRLPRRTHPVRVTGLATAYARHAARAQPQPATDTGRVNSCATGQSGADSIQPFLSDVKQIPPKLPSRNRTRESRRPKPNPVPPAVLANPQLANIRQIKLQTKAATPSFPQNC